jgi:serine/threonine protein kinase
MMQLNEVGNPAILYLRNYRYFQSTEQFLYYLEYCPSLRADFVRLKYKAMKQFIPETFLWFMFYGLAKGLVAMEKGPFGDSLTPGDTQGLYLKRRYVVHRDQAG